MLGYVASVSEKDLKKDNDPLLEVPGFKIGKDGIEKRFEKELRGTGGNLKLEVNALGRVMKEIERVDGVPGERLQLTIDARLQKRLMNCTVKKAAPRFFLPRKTGKCCLSCRRLRTIPTTLSTASVPKYTMPCWPTKEVRF